LYWYSNYIQFASHFMFLKILILFFFNSKHEIYIYTYLITKEIIKYKSTMYDYFLFKNIRYFYLFHAILFYVKNRSFKTTYTINNIIIDIFLC
jgi:hypothetical protein